MRQFLLLCFWVLFGVVADAQPQPQFSLFDINAGTGSSNPREFCVCNGALLFQAFSDNAGAELWISDGTISGTRMLVDINPGRRPGFPDNFTELNGRQYFFAGDARHHRQLWVTDATVAGTYHVSNIDTMFSHASAAAPITNYNGQLLFWGRDSVNGYCLWSSDGTTAGTKLVIDPDTVRDGSLTRSKFYLFKNRLWFVTFSAKSGKRQLWATDGSAAGTQLMSDKIALNDFLVTNDLLYFVGADSMHGKQLWATDGSMPGTRMVLSGPHKKDGCSFIYSSYKGEIYFAGDDSTRKGIFAIDMAKHTERCVLNLNIDATSQSLGVHGDKLYFTVFSNARQSNIMYLSDGTPHGTHPLKDIYGDTVAAGSFFTYGSSTYIKTNCGDSYGMYLLAAGDSVLPLRPQCTVSTGIAYADEYINYKDALWYAGVGDGAGNELWCMQDASALTEGNVSLYPNPSDGHFTISTDNVGFKGHVVIYDIMGREVYFGNIEGLRAEVYIPAAAPGIYMLLLQDISGGENNGAISTYKLLVR